MGKWVVAGMILLWAGSAWAIDPAVKCEKEKLKAAGKYAFCRLQVEARSRFSEPDFSKCDEAFLAKWQKAEDHTLAKGTPCWTMGDAVAVQDLIAAQTDRVASTLSPP